MPFATEQVVDGRIMKGGDYLIVSRPPFPLDPDSLRETAVSFWAQSQVPTRRRRRDRYLSRLPSLCVPSVEAAIDCGPNNKGLGCESLGRTV